MKINDPFIEVFTSIVMGNRITHFFRHNCAEKATLLFVAYIVILKLYNNRKQRATEKFLNVYREWRSIDLNKLKNK